MKSDFDKSDRSTIITLCVFLVFFVVLFFLFVHWQGLIYYDPERTESAINDGEFNYFAFALEYRERRLSLALTYRTFLTSFGFTVGLVLSTIGGIFILRRAAVIFKAGGEVGSAGSKAEAAKVSLATNSPGILFMLGGVAIIIVTQLLAIPVGAPEIFPRDSVVRCSETQRKAGTCSTEEKAKGIDTVAAFCRTQKDDKRCIEFEKLFKGLTNK